MIMPRTLKGAAAPNPDPNGDDSDPELELISLSTVPEVKCFLAPWHLQYSTHLSKYRDHLHILLEYIAEVSIVDMFSTRSILIWIEH